MSQQQEIDARACYICGVPCFTERLLPFEVVCLDCERQHFVQPRLELLAKTDSRDEWSIYMNNTSTACKLCHRLPGLVNLDGLCRDDFELVNVSRPMAAYRQHMQSMIKIAAEVQKAYRKLQGVDPSAVYNPVKHFCKCGYSDVSYMTLAEHINSEGGPAMGHTFRESVEDAPRRVPPSSNGPKKAAAPAQPRRPKWDPSLA